MGKGESKGVFPFFPLGQSCDEGEAHFLSQEPSFQSFSRTRKDDPIDGDYQGQSNSVATTTCARGNGGVTARQQGLCGDTGEGRMELVTLDLAELKS